MKNWKNVQDRDVNSQDMDVLPANSTVKFAFNLYKKMWWKNWNKDGLLQQAWEQSLEEKLKWGLNEHVNLSNF